MYTSARQESEKNACVCAVNTYIRDAQMQLMYGTKTFVLTGNNVKLCNSLTFFFHPPMDCLIFINKNLFYQFLFCHASIDWFA